MSKKLIIALFVFGALAIASGVYLLFSGDTVPPASLNQGYSTTTTSVPTTTDAVSATQTIGQSVQGRDITAYIFGSGSTNLLFVGGIHGGYEYNSVLLSWRLIDYLRENPAVIPDNITVSIIPSANPDGVFAALGTSGRFTQADIPANADFGGPERFNANGVDLNRNFPCNWLPTSRWRGEEVQAGTQAFSEPETRAIRDYVMSFQPDAGVFFHSAAGAVYGAACDGTLGPGTRNLLDTYAAASGYRSVDLFTAYPVTGDVESWMTKLGIPAVSVELSNHTDVEWQKNLAGVKALFNYYSQD